MSNILESVAEISLPAVEVTDADLIAVAKDLNASVQFHLRKSTEDFWKLGEALTRLYNRPTVKGRWREILDEVGINHTSDNQARRLFTATTLEKLAKYSNKTQALRALGILAEATPVKKQERPDQATKPANKSFGEAPIAIETHADLNITKPGANQEAASVVGEAQYSSEEGLAQELIVERQPITATVESSNPLEVLTQIAARLELLVGEEFEFSAEVAAQVERSSKALALLNRKGVVRAAA